MLDTMRQEIRDRLDHIRARLDRLRELDPPQPGASRFVDRDGNRRDRYVLFGADLHRYENRPVPADVLATLESNMGCELPEEFRAFLTDIGCGGGPYYGIDWGFLRDFATPDCAIPFPEGDAGPLYQSDDDEDGLEHGYVLTTSQGCGDFLGVITSGPSRGHVVAINNSTADWRLGPSFLTHYLAWIDQGIAQLDSPARPA
ncbi:SMI1/KNR4 family protein [Spirillospora sp. NPDC052269]